MIGLLRRWAAPPPVLRWAMPTDGYKVVLQFEHGEFRVFDSTGSKKRTREPLPGSPAGLKAMSFTAGGVSWRNGAFLTCAFLYRYSQPLSVEILRRQSLTIGMCNRAPTSGDRNHHIYVVTISPFADQPFQIGESIGGGHAERGGFSSLTVQALLASPEWKRHFILADCEWAVPLVERGTDDSTVVRALVDEFCRRP